MAAIGIDFGTANVRVAILKLGKPYLVEDADGSTSIPAVVSFDPKGTRIGHPALKRAWSHAETTARGAKRVLGRTFDEPIVKAYARTGLIVADKGARVRIGVGGKAGSPETAAGALLAHLLKIATERMGAWPTSAVLCAPAWFGEKQRAALRGVAQDAGITVSRIVSEPVAAGVRLAIPGGPEKRIAVLDIGAGGIGAAVLVVGRSQLRIAGEAGEGLIGGDDFDALLMKSAMAQLTDQVGFVVPTPATLEMLRQTCEEMKIELSSGSSVARPLHYVKSPIRGEAAPTVAFTRAQLEPHFMDIVAGVALCLRRALVTAQLESSALDAVYFNGGMSRIPGLRAAIEDAIGHRAASGLDPVASPALGAALIGASLARQIPLVIEEGPVPFALRKAGSTTEPATPSKEAPSSAPASAPSASPSASPSAASDPSPSGGAPPASQPAAAPPSSASPIDTPATPSAPASTPSPSSAPLPGSAPPAAASSPPLSPAAKSMPPPSLSMPPPPSLSMPPPPLSMPPRISQVPTAISVAPAPLVLPSDSSPAPGSDAPSNRPVATSVYPREVRGGTLRNPTDIHGVLALGVVRPIVEADLEPIALAVLLVRVLGRKQITGTVTLSDGKKQFSIMVIEGLAHLRPQEHPSVHQAFGWGAATFTFDATPPEPGRRDKVPMTRLTMDGLRTIGRGFTEEAMEEALGKNLGRSPTLRADRAQAIKRMVSDNQESRFMEFNLNGKFSAHDLAARSGFKHTVLRLLVLLVLFDALEWNDVEVVAVESAKSIVESRATKMAAGNHFEALALHWSATSAEIDRAREAALEEIAEGTESAVAAPEACERMRDRIEMAYAILSNERTRAIHRREAYPNVDFGAIRELMAQKDMFVPKGETDPRKR